MNINATRGIPTRTDVQVGYAGTNEQVLSQFYENLEGYTIAQRWKTITNKKAHNEKMAETSILQSLI